jgi:hypothetical protein
MEKIKCMNIYTTQQREKINKEEGPRPRKVERSRNKWLSKCSTLRYIISKQALRPSCVCVCVLYVLLHFIDEYSRRKPLYVIWVVGPWIGGSDSGRKADSKQQTNSTTTTTTTSHTRLEK